MFDRILALFQPAPPVTALPPNDARHALGALLVRAAKADRAYLFEEIERIDRVLGELYGLDPVAAARMRAGCEKLDAAIPETADLAAVLHDAIPMDDREAAVAALWQVVFADGVEHEAEDELLHHIEAVLGVSPAKARAMHDAAQAAARAPRQE